MLQVMARYVSLMLQVMARYVSLMLQVMARYVSLMLQVMARYVSLMLQVMARYVSLMLQVTAGQPASYAKLSMHMNYRHSQHEYIVPRMIKLSRIPTTKNLEYTTTTPYGSAAS